MDKTGKQIRSANAEHRANLKEWLKESDKRLNDLEERLSLPQTISECERMLAEYRVELYQNRVRRDEVGKVTEQSTEQVKVKGYKKKSCRCLKKRLLTQ